jgi:8-oxo-dGTP pyrophosphatase MutT (NUDIX family)
MESTNEPPTIAAARLSATAVLFRGIGAAAEVLLVQRSGRLDFHGGAWVFPGGRVDEPEHEAAKGDLIAAARAAAVREVLEETALVITAGDLVPISRWTTPIQSPKRFVTWFFLGPAGERTDVRVDGREIVAGRWVRPAEAIAEHRAGELDIPPPTFVTLLTLSEAPALSHLHAECATREPQIFEPKVVVGEQGFFSLYGGDAGFEDCDVTRPGPRHRLYSTSRGWAYERSGL